MTTVDRTSPAFVLKSLAAGGIAGCAAKTVVAPLDRVKILFQTNNPAFERYQGSLRGVVGASRSIISTDGIAGLFRGHLATLLRIFPYAAIKFMAYEQYKAILIPKQHSRHGTGLVRSSGAEFLAGSLAGMTSVMFTYPLELIRVRVAFDTSISSASSRITSRSLLRGILWRTTREIVTAHDPSTGKPQTRLLNLYRGLSPTLLGMIPYAGVSFAAHGIVADFFRSNITSSVISTNGMVGKRRLKAWAELAAGGLAGIAGQTASYPMEIVRRRMQVVDISRPMPSISDVVREVWRTKGWRGFWVGLSIGYIKVVPLVGVSFATYERCKYWFGIS